MKGWRLILMLTLSVIWDNLQLLALLVLLGGVVGCVVWLCSMGGW